MQALALVSYSKAVELALKHECLELALSLVKRAGNPVDLWLQLAKALLQKDPKKLNFVLKESPLKFNQILKFLPKETKLSTEIREHLKLSFLRELHELQQLHSVLESQSRDYATKPQKSKSKLTINPCQLCHFC